MTARMWRRIVNSSVVATVALTVTSFVLWGVAIFIEHGHDLGALGVLTALAALCSGGTWAGTLDAARKAEKAEHDTELGRLRDEVRKSRDYQRGRDTSAYALARQLRAVSRDGEQMFLEWWRGS